MLGHAVFGLQSIARLGPSASAKCEQALRVELPEIDDPSVSALRAELGLVCAGCCLDISRALAASFASAPEGAAPAPSGPSGFVSTSAATQAAADAQRDRRLCASAALLLLRAAARGLLLHVFRIGAPGAYRNGTVTAP